MEDEIGVKIIGWRNMYHYLKQRGYEGDRTSLKVCEEADRRGFRISHSSSLIFQIRK